MAQNDRSTTTFSPTPANRLGLDYRAEAERLGPPPAPMIDVHSHINGTRASAIYAQARAAYGMTRTISMTQINEVENVRATLGDSIEFIAVPSYHEPTADNILGDGFLRTIEEFHALGSRMVKFWVAPRSIDFAEELGAPGRNALDSEMRMRAMELAQSLGMMFMTHVADPDTWFKTKYTDSARYGTKPDQYRPLEHVLDRFDSPWIAAHMGGWPEDLEFLDGLLSRHDNLYLDTSACKWMVRELSRHSVEDFRSFFTKWTGRLLFGTDIVTMDAHLKQDDGPRGMGAQAASTDEAFDLYASRMWALRTLFETDYDGESPIADPDLAMVDPDSHDAMSAPALQGKGLPAETLRTLYHDAAVTLIDGWRAKHG